MSTVKTQNIEGTENNSSTRYRSHHGMTKDSNKNFDFNSHQFSESNKNSKNKLNKRAPIENPVPKPEEENINNKKKLQNDDDIDFEPEEIEKNKLTNVDLPKFRFFDTKVNLPIMENDPDHRSLNGEEDPFPLGPEKIKDIEDHTKELESIK